MCVTYVLYEDRCPGSIVLIHLVWFCQQSYRHRFSILEFLDDFYHIIGVLVFCLWNRVCFEWSDGHRLGGHSQGGSL